MFIDGAATTIYDAHYGMVGNPDFFAWYNYHVNTSPRYRAKIWSCVDVLTPLSGTVSASCPIVMSWCGGYSTASTSTADWDTGGAFVADSSAAIGAATGNNTLGTKVAINEGGAFTCVPGVNTTSCLRFTTYALYNKDLLGPNPNNGDAYDIYPIYCYNSEHAMGALGFLPYTHCVSSHMGVHTIPTGSIYTAPVVMCSVGTNVANKGNFLIPWIGDAPGDNLSRSGRSFT